MFTESYPFLNVETNYYTNYHNLFNLLHYKNAGEIAQYIVAQSAPILQKDSQNYSIEMKSAIKTIMTKPSYIFNFNGIDSVYDAIIYYKQNFDKLVFIYNNMQSKQSQKTFLYLLLYSLFEKEEYLQEISSYENVFLQNTPKTGCKGLKEVIIIAYTYLTFNNTSMEITYFRSADLSHHISIFKDNIDETMDQHYTENYHVLYQDIEKISELSESYKEGLDYILKCCENKDIEQVFSMLPIMDKVNDSIGTIMKKYYLVYDKVEE